MDKLIDLCVKKKYKVIVPGPTWEARALALRFNDFIKEFKQMVADNPSPEPFTRIVHFFDEVIGEGRPALVLFDHKTEPIEVPYLEWSIYCQDGKFSILQIPLIYAWSFTIHKAQGMSLDYADIDLKHIFEDGQFYVALSRLKSLEGLRILHLDIKKCKANPKIVEFYRYCFPPIHTLDSKIVIPSFLRPSQPQPKKKEEKKPRLSIKTKMPNEKDDFNIKIIETIVPKGEDKEEKIEDFYETNPFAFKPTNKNNYKEDILNQIFGSEFTKFLLYAEQPDNKSHNPSFNKKRKL